VRENIVKYTHSGKRKKRNNFCETNENKLDRSRKETVEHLTETDGRQHYEETGKKRDEERTREFRNPP